MSVRGAIATAIGRSVRWVLHDLLGRSASQLPGRLALSLDPQVVAHLRGKVQAGSVVVCGTNGKTTTTNLIAQALEASGARVLCNRDGANMLAGVASALLAGSSADWAVIEADELSCIHILPQLQPRYLVLLNLFRDQLDRAGEIDHVQDILVAALASSPDTTLLVCGDDPLSMGVAQRARAAGTQVLSFGIDEDLHLPPDRVPEARFCQQCGAELTYAYRSYAQLGAFSCPSCSFARPKLDIAATGVEVTSIGVAFDISRDHIARTRRIHAGFGGVYMVYNLLGAAAVCAMLGVDPAYFQQTLDDYDPDNGRLQHFAIDGREVTLNLAKNPTGLNQNLSLLMTDERPKAVYVVINDDFNDGRDISWLWDVDFERLADSDTVRRVIAGGHRANDLQVRFKYAGIQAPVAEGLDAAFAKIDDLPRDHPFYVLTNYSALRPAREELERREGKHA